MKILAITGIRSDYDLMSSLYRSLARDKDVDFRLLVSGAHLSRNYDYSIEEIIEDELTILATIESLIDSDSMASRVKTASILMQGSVDIISSWNPDLIIYAGDREEVLIGSMIGNYLEIPTAHFYSGDHTITGHVDNPVRHAASKLSTVHFVAIDEHKQRLQKMGESPERIHVVGNISLDNFKHTVLLTTKELQEQIQLPNDFQNPVLVLFHPDPSEKETAGEILETILDALQTHDLHCCVGYPNTDPANRSIIDVIERHKNKKNVFVYKNLNRRQFISLYKRSKFIIGNSSSGILEAASVPVPAISVGLRQRGRLASSNVIFCDADLASIQQSIAKATSPQFLTEIRGIVNPYGEGESTKMSHHLIKTIDFKALRLKIEDPLLFQ